MNATLLASRRRAGPSRIMPGKRFRYWLKIKPRPKESLAGATTAIATRRNFRESFDSRSHTTNPASVVAIKFRKPKR